MAVSLGLASRPDNDIINAWLRKKQLEQAKELADKERKAADRRADNASTNALAAATAGAQMRQEIEKRQLEAMERQARANRIAQAEMQGRALEVQRLRDIERARLEDRSLAIQANQQRLNASRYSQNQFQMLDTLDRQEDKILADETLNEQQRAQAIQRINQRRALIVPRAQRSTPEQQAAEAKFKMETELAGQKMLDNERELGSNWKHAAERVKAATNGMYDRTQESEPLWWKKDRPTPAQLETAINNRIEAMQAARIAKEEGKESRELKPEEIEKIKADVYRENGLPVPNATSLPSPTSPAEALRLGPGAKWWDSKNGRVITNPSNINPIWKQLQPASPAAAPQVAPSPQAAPMEPSFGALLNRGKPAAAIRVPPAFQTEAYQKLFLAEPKAMSRSQFEKYEKVFERSAKRTPAQTDAAYRQYLQARSAVRSQIPSAAREDEIPVAPGKPYFAPNGELRRNVDGRPVAVPAAEIPKLIAPIVEPKDVDKPIDQKTRQELIEEERKKREKLSDPFSQQGSSMRPLTVGGLASSPAISYDGKEFNMPAAIVPELARGNAGSLQDLSPAIANRDVKLDEAKRKQEWDKYQKELIRWENTPQVAWRYVPTNSGGVALIADERGPRPAVPYGAGTAAAATPNAAFTAPVFFASSPMSGDMSFRGAQLPQSYGYSEPAARTEYAPQFSGSVQRTWRPPVTQTAPYEEPWSQQAPASSWYDEYFPPFFGDPSYMNTNEGFYPAGDYNINTDYVGYV